MNNLMNEPQEGINLSPKFETKTKGKIDDILETVPLDVEIRIQTKLFYESLRANVVRYESKIQAIYYCILAAQEYLKDRYPSVPAHVIAQNLSMKKNICEKSIKKYHGKIPDYIPTGYTDALDIIQYYSNKLQWQNSSDEIDREWNFLLTINPKIRDLNPVKSAAGYIYYYIRSKGFEVEPATIAKEFMITVKHLENVNKKILDTMEQHINKSLDREKF